VSVRQRYAGSAEASGDDLPIVAVRAACRQVQLDAPHRGLYLGAKLQEVFARVLTRADRKGMPDAADDANQLILFN
jgi:hypothetical protein